MLKQQKGSFLIEALISILLFMSGMLALMGVTATAINQVSQTKYRNDASNLASEVIGQMYTNWDGVNAYDHSGWDTRVSEQLPGGNVDTFTITANRVDIALSWSDKNNARYNYITSSVISK
jgi:type IV pilus assembly protein PilV